VQTLLGEKTRKEKGARGGEEMLVMEKTGNSWRSLSHVSGLRGAKEKTPYQLSAGGKEKVRQKGKESLPVERSYSQSKEGGGRNPYLSQSPRKKVCERL